jgi:hypothetical protein
MVSKGADRQLRHLGQSQDQESTNKQKLWPTLLQQTPFSWPELKKQRLKALPACTSHSRLAIRSVLREPEDSIESSAAGKHQALRVERE